MADYCHCSGDYRDACSLFGQGLRHISLIRLPRGDCIISNFYWKLAAYLDTSNQTIVTDWYQQNPNSSLTKKG